MAKKYTLITGASSGMGALCAKQLSANRNLIIASENYDALQSVKLQCSNQENILLWQCNFATERSEILDSLLKILEQEDAYIEDYLHFAGITCLSSVRTISIQNIDLVFNVNFFSILEILKVILKKKYKSQLKSIVLISALVSERGNVGNSVYAASKGAINSLTYSLSRELAPIRINALLPGAIESPMTRGLDPEYIEQMTNDTPLGIGSPQDVVNYAEFLLSDKAKWITGQTIYVDGGRNTK